MFLIFYIVGDLASLIDKTLVFKDDLIRSALQTLLDIKRIHENQKKEEKVKKSKKGKNDSISLNKNKSKKKSKPTRRKKNTSGKEDQTVFVGIHSRLVSFLFWTNILLHLIIFFEIRSNDYK